MTRDWDLDRVDLALVFGDPDLPDFRVVAMKQTVGVPVDAALIVAGRRYPGITEDELDRVVAMRGGDRLQQVNLDLWPAVRRFVRRLAGKPVKKPPDIYWVRKDDLPSLIGYGPTA